MSWILGIVAVCGLGVSFIFALIYLAITLFGKAGKHISCFAIPGGCVSWALGARNLAGLQWQVPSCSAREDSPMLPAACGWAALWQRACALCPAKQTTCTPPHSPARPCSLRCRPVHMATVSRISTGAQQMCLQAAAGLHHGGVLCAGSAADAQLHRRHRGRALHGLADLGLGAGHGLCAPLVPGRPFCLLCAPLVSSMLDSYAVMGSFVVRLCHGSPAV